MTTRALFVALACAFFPVLLLAVAVPPTITSFSPAAIAPGLPVVITGTDFSGANSVTFNGVTAASFTVNSATQITASAAVGLTSGVISVVTAGGTATSSAYTVTTQPIITGFSPASGPVGRIVRITGANFQGFDPPTVTFNGIISSYPKTWSDNYIELAVPAGAATGPIVVTTSQGSATGAANFVVATGTAPANDNFIAAQAISGASGTVTGSNTNATKEPGEPPHGGNAGGASVWFSWTAPSTGRFSFYNSTGNFGANLGVYTGAAVGSLTTIASGSVSSPYQSYASAVSFNAASGTTYYIALDGYDGLNGDYTLAWDPVAAPTVSSFSPGSAYAGQRLFVNGTGFLPGTSVVVGGATVAPGNVNVSSPTFLSVNKVPFNSATGVVTVTTIAGSGSSAGNLTITAPPAPTVASFSPASGTVGTLVSIQGTALALGDAPPVVKFNGTTVTSISSEGSTNLWVYVPTGATSGLISVATSAGTGTSSTNFTVSTPPAPTVTSFTPPLMAGGLTAVITGTNLTGATGVTFNGATAASFTVNSSTQITATVPAGVTAGVIAVTTPGGTATSAAYGVTTLPNITGFSPSSGPVKRIVRITGANFQGFEPQTVTFNGVISNAPKSWGNNFIDVAVPVGATTGRIVVTTSQGSVTSASDFVVASGTAPANDNFASAQTLSGAAGTYSGGNTNATKEANEPNHGGNAGGASVWFGWTAPSTGRFAFYESSGNFAANLGIYTGASVGALTALGSGNAGTVTTYQTYNSAVSFTANAGTSYYIALDGYDGFNGDFTLAWMPVASPTVISFSPGSVYAGQNLNVTGTGFLPGATVVVGGATVSAANVTVNSPTSLSVFKVPYSAATGVVTVTTTAGSGSSSGNVTITAPPAPTVAGFTPSAGLAGAVVNITGTALALGDAPPVVKFNGTAVTVISSESSTSLYVSVPAGATSGPISVTTSAGTGASSTNFTVNLPPGPTVASVSPAAASAGQAVVITGTGFTGATSVTFNGIAATTFTVNSATQITATVPTLGTTGAIAVTTASGTGSSPGTFTVVPAGVDNFANRTALTGTSASALVNNFTASKESGEPNHAGDGGGKSVWWTWTASASGKVTVDALGNGFNVLLGVYTGGSVSALTPVASAGFVSAAKVTFDAVAGTAYQIAVDGAGGASGNLGLSVGYAYAFTTLAGDSGIGSADGTGSAARFNHPNGAAIDASGNVYITDAGNYTVRKMTAAGVVTTIAGLAGTSGSVDNSGVAARFNFPRGLAIDGSGNLYVADGSTIRKITPGGVVTTLAGVSNSGGHLDGTGSAARFMVLQGLAIDSGGNVYVADSWDFTIRKVTPGGVVTTLAGSPGGYGSADGTGSAAQFGSPTGVGVDSSGNVYVADSDNHTIRKVTPAGVVTTFAGTAGSSGTTDGTGSAARFFRPNGVAVDAGGNILVTDGSNLIRKITPAGVVTTLAGNAADGAGSSDGTGVAAKFDSPQGMAIDAGGTIYVADGNNHTIRRISVAAVVTTVAGMPGRGSADGTGGAARFDSPQSVAVDGSGNLYVADDRSHTIRKITAAGVVTTFAGTADSSGSTDGTGSGARFNRPKAVAVDGSGNVLVADTANNTVRRITPAGVVTTIAGTLGSFGNVDGSGTAARFGTSYGIAVDSSGNAYVSDNSFNTIRKITSLGVVSTLAGTAGTAGSLDGAGSLARFNGPWGVAVDSSGSVYVAEQWNNTIRKITGGGLVSTLAGTAGVFGSSDGVGSAAQFSNPLDLAVDSGGSVFVAVNGAIRKITPSGIVTTMAGASGAYWGNADGLGAAVRFGDPRGVAVDNNGTVYVADPGNHTIRKGVLAFAPQIQAQPVSQTGVTAGATVNFSVTPAAGLPVTYQWSFNGSPIAGATSNPLILTNVSGANVGSYAVTLTNLAGSTTSSSVTLSGSNFPPTITSVAPTTAIAGQSVVITGTGFTGATAVTFNGVAATSFTVNSATQITATVPALGTTGAVAVTTTNGTGSSPTSLTVVPAGADNFANRTTLTGASASATVNNTSATKETGEPNHAGNAGGRSVWWTWTAPSSGKVTIDTAGSNFSTLLGIYTGTAVNNGLTAVATGFGSTGKWTFDAAAGTAYQIAVDGAGGANGIISLSVGYAYGFFTFAGDSGYGRVDGTGSAARFNVPYGVAVDTTGNLYVADTNNHTIRKIAPGGVVTTLAGQPGFWGGADGTGSSAQFHSPVGIAVDSSGNLFVGDQQNHTIRKITPAGVVTTIAGLAGNSGSADGTGSAARFNNPYGVALDGSGNLYVVDTSNQLIRRVVISTGVVTTVAGQVGISGSADGTGSAAQFYFPIGIAVDGSGNIFVGDQQNGVVRKINSGGVVTTFAGAAGNFGSADGTGTAARFNVPYGVAADASGSVYVADNSNQTIRKITAAGLVTTLAGAQGVTGSVDGTGSAAQFRYPVGVAVDSGGNVYVADTSNNLIRKVTATGAVTTVAGATGVGSNDGTGSAARFSITAGVAVDATTGTVYVADQRNQTIRKITAAGAVTTLAGSVGTVGSLDGTGAAARFNYPVGVAADGGGNVFVADGSNHTIRKITSGGVVTTLAGSAGIPGATDGPASAARFNLPLSVALDAGGNLYVADTSNHTIRKITSAGAVTTLAGLAGSSGSADGAGSVARFNRPRGVAVDSSGNVYVADQLNPTVRKISAAGVVTTLAGLAGSWGNADGTGSVARFASPTGVAVDAAGNVYVTDEQTCSVRKISAGGIVTTVGGGGSGSGDGVGIGAQFASPGGLALDSSGNLYIADTYNNTIRKGVPALAPLIQTQPVSVTNATVGATVNFLVVPNSLLPVTYQWSFNGSPITTGTADTLVLTNVSIANVGSYSVRLTSMAGGITSSVVSLSGSNFPPTITTVAPTSAGPGSSVVLTGTGFTGATSVAFNGVNSTFTVDSATQITATVPAIATTGNIVVTTANGAGNTAAPFTVTTVRALINESTRLALTAASPTAVVSFTIEGSVAKTMLLRAVGPTLGAAPFNVSGILTDPELTLYNSAGAQVAGNDDWGNSTAVANAASAVGAFALNANSADSALLVTLSPGTYTAQVAAPFGGTGIVLLEVYDTDTNSRLRHLATRGFAGTGGSVLTTGIVVSGSTPQMFLVRALGPALRLAGTLADPTLTIYSGPTVVASNDNWDGASAGLADATATAGAMPLAAGSADAATVVTLAPGAYTVQVSGVGGTTGIAQVEIFQIDGNIAATSKPALLVPMLNSSVNAGGSVTLAAPFVAKPNAVGFQWRKDGAAIADATNASYNLGSTTLADGGNYSVDLMNSAGTTVSAPMRLTVIPAGADSFAGRTVISGTSPSAVANNASATKETNEPNHAGNTGGKSVWWSWTAPTSGQVTISTVGSSFNTVLGVYTGTAVSALTIVASDNDSGGNTTSKVTFNATGGATYQIAVDGSGGASGTISLSVGYTYVFVPFAGETAYGSVDGTGSAARLENPWAVAVDGSGNLYVADTANHTIRKIAAGGVVTTLAGTAGKPGTTDGTGAAARFNWPRGIVVDSTGNVFVADTLSHTIRKITSAGVVTTFAGTASSSGSLDGTGTAARFNSPQGMARDVDNNLYVADTANHTIRRISPAGVVTTLAGVAGSSGSTDGSSGSERFNLPQSVGVDAAGNVYVADTFNQTVRKITITSGSVVSTSTVAGVAGSLGSTDGTGTAARFDYPHAVTVDGSGNLFVLDAGSSTIRRIASGGVVTTVVGQANVTGSTDGTGSAARFNWPRGMAADTAGNLFVADTINHEIRQVTSGGVVTTIAGLASTAGAVNGTGSGARFNYPTGLATDLAGNVYVADRSNHVVRQISPTGAVVTIAGLAGTPGAVDGTGGDARFNSPYGVAVDGSGNVFVADTGNFTIRKITTTGVVTTIAGAAGSSGSADGATGSAARFNAPQGVAVDSSGNVFVADTGNFTIRKITSAGVVTTVAGSAGISGGANGTGATARFDSPRGIVLDSAGNLYVAEYTGNTIRRVTPGGVVTTVAGIASFRGRIDGSGTDARMDLPLSVALDAGGNLYVAEKFYPTVRKITPGGTVSILGQPGRSGSTLGSVYPSWPDDGDGIAVDGGGNVYVADSRNNTILKGVPAYAPQIATQPVNQTANAGTTATFTVTPTSTLPVSYQWSFNGAAISGATTGTLSLSNVSSDNAGTYAVSVFNQGGSITSSAVTLTVNSPPAIVAQPAHTTAIIGGTLTLTAQVSGTEPLSYQWRYSGPSTEGFVNVSGAVGPTLVISNFTAANVGSYQLYVSNALATNVASAVANVFAADPASTWVADPSFNRPQFRVAVPPSRVTVAPDGSFYVTWVNGALVTGVNNTRVGPILHFLSGGTIDTAFNPGASLIDALAVVVQPNGQILVGGVDASEGSDSGSPVCRVFRLNANGARDSSYRSPAFYGLPRFMTLQSDGKLLVSAGPPSSSPSKGIFTLARLNTDGSLDTGFTQPNFGASGNGYIFAPIVVDSAGRVLIAGTFTSVNGVTRSNLARLNSNGSVDTTFVPSGYTTAGTNTQIRGLAVQGLSANAGKILVAGGTITVSGSDRPVIRLNAADGSLDTSFTLTTQGTAGMNPRPRLLVLNSANDGFTIVGATVKRFDANGNVDGTLTSPTITAPQFGNEFYWLEQLADGSMLIPISETGASINGTPVSGIARLASSGALDTSFNPGVFQMEVFGDSLSVQSDSRPLFLGSFDTVNTTARIGLARFSTSGALDSLALSGLANLARIEEGSVRSDGSFIVKAATGTSPANYSSSIRVFNADGALNSTFSLDSAVQGVLFNENADGELLADDRFLVGSNTPQRVLNGSVYFTRVNANGSLDATFTGLGTTNYGAVYRSGTTITQLVVGEFNILGHYADGRTLVAVTTAHTQNASSLPVTVIRLNANGTPDSTFTGPTVSAAMISGFVPGTINDPVTSTAVQPPLLQLDHSPFVGVEILSDNRILLGGDFTSLGDHPTTQIARLNANGGVDTTFSTGSGPAFRYRSDRRAHPTHIAVAPNGKYWVMGAFDTFNGYAAPGIVRLNSDGSVDTTFATDIGYRSLVSNRARAVVAADGSVYLAGSYAKASDLMPYAITRLIVPVAASITAPLATSSSVLLNGTVTLSVTAAGSPAPTYQWLFNNQPIAGATGPAYTITNATQANAGTYTVLVSNPFLTTPVSNSTTLAVIDRSLLNLLSRVAVPARGAVTASFTVEGGAKNILIRGVGPSLTGVAGVLVDPRLTLLNASFATIGTNNDWGAPQTVAGGPAPASAGAISAAITAVGASPGFTSGSKDAALLVNLAPGTYTVALDGVGGAGGTAQLDVVDADTGAWPRVAMLAMRGPVTSSNHLIIGFTLTGAATRQYLLRVLGPTLGPNYYGNNGVLIDPWIDLYQSPGTSRIAYDDDSGPNTAVDTAAASVGAMPRESQYNYDSTLLLMLQPATYTADIRPYSTDEWGDALFEIFAVDDQRPTTIAPAITYLASDQLAVVQGDAALGVVAVSKPAATFQWRRYLNGVPTPVTGATASIFRLTNIQLSDSGSSFDVVISNGASTVISPPRTITVIPPFHSADTNRDGQISTAELTRVIQLYNYQSGATRTGEYHVQADTEDGFALGPGVLTAYHSADFNRDGRIDSDELLRVIELFNYRNGTVRTGDYHSQNGTEDGFAPGPIPQ